MGTGLEQLRWSQLWLPTRRWLRQQWSGECQGDNKLTAAEAWVLAPCMRRCTLKLSCLHLPWKSCESGMLVERDSHWKVTEAAVGVQYLCI